MVPEKTEEEQLALEIVNFRNLPYTLSIERIDGNKIYCRSSWGNHILYIRKDGEFFIESEL
ncbi:MAG: hypothetical protein ACTSWY_01940 [Promethearchaeota archaeon]